MQYCQPGHAGPYAHQSRTIRRVLSYALRRLLLKLLASMHILDCLKDSKQTLRDALSAVTAQEGDEQQLLTAVQVRNP